MFTRTQTRPVARWLAAASPPPVVTVFVMLGCTWVLLWLLNSAQQLNSKVHMQNAVDAAGQSGTGILARGMNAVAFANQLEADLLAAVAVLRASQQMPGTPSPLVGVLLPVFENILSGQSGQLSVDRPITAFRHDVVRRIPSLADEVTRNVGRANGRWRGIDSASNPDGPQGPLLVQLWTTSGQPVSSGNENHPQSRTLPLIDASSEGPDAAYLPDPDAWLKIARQERELMVQHYIPLWALDAAAGDSVQAALLITRAQFELRVLLDDLYPRSNLPMVLRLQSDSRTEVERDLMFVAVAYRLHPSPTAAKMFRNPNSALAPAMAFAQTHLFLPRPRYVCCPWGETVIDPVTGEDQFVSRTDGWPIAWESSTQNWQAKLVPATAWTLSSILSRVPQNANFNQPTWGQLTPRQMDELTHH